MTGKKILVNIFFTLLTRQAKTNAFAISCQLSAVSNELSEKCIPVVVFPIADCWLLTVNGN